MSEKIHFPEGIDSQNVDWQRFQKNPVLLLDHDFAGPLLGYFTSLDTVEAKGNIAMIDADLRLIYRHTTIDALQKGLEDGTFILGAGGYRGADGRFELMEVSIIPNDR